MSAERSVAEIISQKDIEDFARDGAVCLRNAFDKNWLTVLAKGVEVNMKKPGPDACRYTPSDGPGGFYDDYCNWDKIEEYRDFLFHSPAAEIAGRLMQAKEVRLFHEHVLIKEPGTLEKSPWHHDQPYYCIDGDMACSIWLPLDPIPLTSSLEFVAGSYDWGKMFMPRKFVNHEDYDYEKGSFESVPDIESNRADYEILSWELELGDCLVFHMRTLHSAPGTAHSKSRRRGFSSRWMGEDVVFAKRPGKTSPPFPDLKRKFGEPMDDPLFPICWQA